ncbi:MAG TPA: hypothetical protein VH142_20015, partial [Polyangiaceae bacterium]|nr:hypothetical protein [Polyangiaceae bacterium]
MRSLLISTFVLSATGALALACGSTSDNCLEVKNCAPSATGGSSGNGGASGTGGASGSGGKAGSGGATGGASGASGASGSGGGSGTGGAPSSGGTDGGTPDAGDAEAGPKCDEKKSPDVEPCLVTDDHVVFVAPGATGADSGVGAGTMASPAHTISEGIILAGATGKTIVVVCNATYAEEVTIPAVKSAIGLYGGFNCPDGTATPWAYNGTAHATVEPSVPGPALDIENAEGAVVIADIAFTAMDAPKPTNKAAAQSSIGAIVNASSNVTFQRVTITAGNGADGLDGATGTDGAPGVTAGDAPVGVAASCASDAPTQQFGGAWSVSSQCGSQGGGGGTAQKQGGSPGVAGSPDNNTTTPPNDDNHGNGDSTVGEDVQDTGKPGAVGNDGALGPQAVSSGVFAAGGFTPADGQPGTDGNPGQGGGGGGSSAGTATCVGASGGAGGMGGCGGMHGEAGKGGGASIALLVWGSGVTLDTVALITAKGGKGGTGGDSGVFGHGESGGAGGGSPDGGVHIGAAGGGGKGGDGGNGGSGSGGTGGPSIAIVFNGIAPTGSTRTT